MSTRTVGTEARHDGNRIFGGAELSKKGRSAGRQKKSQWTVEGSTADNVPHRLGFKDKALCQAYSFLHRYSNLAESFFKAHYLVT